MTNGGPTTRSLLALLQLNDSAFPAGGFAHSFGLEQAVRDGSVTSAAGVEAFVRSLLRHSVATADAAAAARAASCAADGDLALVERIDRDLFATKAASELRGAATSMGLRLLQEVTLHIYEPLPRALLADVQPGATPGTHAAMFGCVSGSLGVSAEDAAAALMLGTATALLQASMRLLPVSHRDVQGTLHRLRDEITELAAEAVVINQPSSFHPMQEIASMRHRRAAVRFFAS